MKSSHYMSQEVYKINCNAGQSKLIEWKALQVFFFSKMIRKTDPGRETLPIENLKEIIQTSTQVEGVWRRDSSLRVGNVSLFRAGQEE